MSYIKTSMFLSHINKVVEQGDSPNLDSVCAMLSGHKLERVDVDGANIGVKYNIGDLKKTLDNNEIKVSSIFFVNQFDWKNKNSLEKISEETKKQLEYCAFLGTELFMPVPNMPDEHKNEIERIECQKIMMEYLNETADSSKKYGITTVIENYSAYRNPYSKPEDFETIFKNTSGVEYVLDTGNFWFCDADFLEIYEKYVDITKHVHLKDISPNPKGFLDINGKVADSNDIGSGIIDFPELFKRLKRDGYNGSVSIEICNSDNMLDKLIKSLNYVNSLKI